MYIVLAGGSGQSGQVRVCGERERFADMSTSERKNGSRGELPFRCRRREACRIYRWTRRRPEQDYVDSGRLLVPQINTVAKETVGGNENFP